ncbi:MAG: zinc-dependent alcohol dehydrogenase [Candidatus Helarchaeota archaeon]
MKAAVLRDSGINIETVPKPIPREGQVLIKNIAVGICKTDISIIKGDYKIPLPRILGHEFAGIIEEVGNGVKGLKPGDRVTSEINISCGHCYFCRSGQRTQCLTVKAIGIYEDGAFAEYTLTPAYNVHKIGNIDFNNATFIEPLAAAINTFDMSPLKKQHKNVVVIGAGKLGLLILQVAKIYGRKVIVIGKSHLNLAKNLGADMIINAQKEDFRKIIYDHTNEVGADVVVETTGNPQGIEMALDIIRNRGLICLKSTHGLMVPLDLTKIVVKELHLQGSRCGNFKKAIKMFHKIRVKPLISKIYSLNDIKKAIKEAQKSENIKIIIRPFD